MRPDKSSKNNQIDTPRQLLDEVYTALRYEQGSLVDAVALPDENTKNVWVNKGEWLSLASAVGAEKIFFVNNDPVIVFCTHESSNDQELLKLFRRHWCMARPQCLFLALPGELRVYSLNQDPVRSVEEWSKFEPLDVINRVADVAEKLQDYSRENVETGQLFIEKSFGDIDQRADKRLINDLKYVRMALLDTGLEMRHAHALIGRSIFIRYLEDREILTYEYFAGVAEQNAKWEMELSTEHKQLVHTQSDHIRWYDRILRNKEFTYALFEQLADDFNGDMFPRDPSEESAVNQEHLELLRKFLLGDADPYQPALFLWAYDFDIIPTDLISNIYEEFYHANNLDDKGTHYTPSVLVEYALGEILDDSVLATSPRILDPACGSGIFLVEAFRRIVRYKVKNLQRQLTSDELRKILREQIVGIEINTEAIHVASFSLYLALLNYQEPRDIRQNPRLPNLIFRDVDIIDNVNFGILHNNNAFSLTETEYQALTKKLETVPKFKGRADLERFLEIAGKLPLHQHSFDVVIGNPPWGASKGISIEIQTGWCQAFSWPVGFNEPSQAFIGRILALLKSNGTCGFLVSTGVFLKNHRKSEEFRERLLQQVTLKSVANFAHVRHVFFSADASFAFIHFVANKPSERTKFKYWSAKRTDIVDQLHVIVLNHNDLKRVEQRAVRDSSYLWKTFWWGSHRDAALINTLQLYPSLDEQIKNHEWGSIHRGFEGAIKSAKPRPSLWLTQYKELPTPYFTRFGSIDQASLISVPTEVHRRGGREIYEGWRILVKRTQNEPGAPNGIIVARLESMDYCFQKNIYGFSVESASEWQRKVLIGILWSSVARYFLFLTSSGWGIYHYEVHIHELKKLPIKLPTKMKLQNRIVEIVEALLERSNKDHQPLLVEENASETTDLEQKLNEAIYDLYDLTQAERELIEDMCQTGLQLLYRDTSKEALSRVELEISSLTGNLESLKKQPSSTVSINNYINAFLQIWNKELTPENAELIWEVVRPSGVPMLAIVFTTRNKDESSVISDSPRNSWSSVLTRCADILRQPISHHIYIDGMVRAVTDTQIYIIKRDERRLWTRSMAREDAEATLLQAMNLQSTTTSLG